MVPSHRRAEVLPKQTLPKYLLLTVSLVALATLSRVATTVYFNHALVVQTNPEESLSQKYLPSFLSSSPPKRWVNQLRPFPVTTIGSAPFASLVEQVYAIVPELISIVPLTMSEIKATNPTCLSLEHGVSQKLWIALPACRDAVLLGRVLESIASQRRSSSDWSVLEVKLVVYEDFSDEDMMPEDEKRRYEKRLDITWLVSKDCDDPMDLKSCRKVGPAGGTWLIFEEIMRLALPNDYVLLLDGDEQRELSDDSILSFLSADVLPLKAWFMWGRRGGVQAEQSCADIPTRPRHGMVRDDYTGPDRGGEESVVEDGGDEFKDWRTGKWSLCHHPLVFRAFLLKHLTVEDFKQANGAEWLQESTDRPFVFQMLERSGAHRTHFIKERPLLLHNTLTGDSNNRLQKISGSISGNKKANANSSLRRPVSRMLPEVINVVAAVYNRANTATFMQHLSRSLPPYAGGVYVFHLPVNNLSRVPELLELSWRYSTPTHVFRIHTPDKNYGGMARFLVARTLLREGPLDYIIMIDDDMMVYADSLAKLYKQRRPESYVTWFGKTWTGPEDNYWKHSGPKTWALNKSLRRDVKYWQYGGTGFSVIDAAVFNDERIFQIPEKYLFVEDVWLSYVVHINGWTIPRVLDASFIMDEAASANGQYRALRDNKSKMLQELNNCPVSFFNISSAFKAKDYDVGANIEVKDAPEILIWLLRTFGTYFGIGLFFSLLALTWYWT